MNTKFDELLKINIINKCKVAMACAFQEDDKQPVILNEYELAYIVAVLKGELHGKLP